MPHLSHNRSDQRDVGDVDEDDFENPNRALSPGRGGRGSFNAGNTKGGRDQKTFPLDEELKEQDENTGSAGQALDSTSGMNKGTVLTSCDFVYRRAEA